MKGPKFLLEFVVAFLGGLDAAAPFRGVFHLALPPVEALDGPLDLNAGGQAALHELAGNLHRVVFVVDRRNDLQETAHGITFRAIQRKSS